VVVATIAVLTLKGLPWLMTLGMLASIILYYRLKNATTVRRSQAEAGLPARQALLEMRSLMLPIIGITFITGFLNANLVVYLPTFMSKEGAVFALAGISLTIVELGGALGVFLMSMFSDRLGQRNIALVGTLASVAFSWAFLSTQGWLQYLLLFGLGMSAFIANPAFLAMIQTRFTKNSSLANGVYMSSAFVLRSVVVVIVGILADRYGMRSVFMGSSLAALLAVPIILTLPASKSTSS
jgi:FSR family fosmidomycin resistance protein-like MFS transporter